MYSPKRILLVLSVLLQSLLLDSVKTTHHGDRLTTSLTTSLDDELDADDVTNNPTRETGPPNRRQYGPVQQFQAPKSDQDIQRLLSQYRSIVKRYGPGNQQANNGQNLQPNYNFEENNTDRFYSRQREPLRYDPRWREHVVSSHPAVGRQFKYPEKPEPNSKETRDDVPATPAMVPPGDVNSTGGGLTTQGTTNEAAAAAVRFTTRTTTTRRRRRTTPPRVSFQEECDYIAYYCLKAFTTGKICARTLYMIHMTFENYCMVDYVNCMERYDVWQIAHMGECFRVHVLTEYVHYPYNDDYFLDNYYIVEDM